jgi:putative MATE family efflux protein
MRSKNAIRKKLDMLAKLSFIFIFATMKTGIPTYKQIWQVSYPIILSLLAQNIINVTDTAFLGRVGEVELGAAAIAGLFYIAVFMLGFGFSTGTQIMIGRRNGEKDFKKIGVIFDQSSYFFLMLGLALFFLIYFFGSPLLNHIVSSHHIMVASEIYLKIRVFGILFAFGNLAFRALLVGITQTKALGYSAVVMAVTNVILDYVLIFGLYGFPQMGIGGAALASVIAEFVSFAFFIIYSRLYIDSRKYDLFILKKIDFKAIGKTLEISVYVMIQYFISVATWFSFFAVIEQMGERPLAIANIIRSMYMFLVIPIMGLSTATNTIVSNAIGAGFSQDVLKIINKIVKISLLSVLPIIAFMVAFPRLLVSIYTNSPDLIAETIPSVYTISIAIVIFAVAFVVFSGVSGTANTKTALGIELITLVIYLSYVYWVAIVKQWPVEIAWTSEYIYMFFLSLFSYWYIIGDRWKSKVI